MSVHPGSLRKEVSNRSAHVVIDFGTSKGHNQWLLVWHGYKENCMTSVSVKQLRSFPSRVR
ncbi:hypothetical protein C0Q70_00935 [Pomacea canaliculata]|uniref:Uncharacterized protein n=1 Tax=Pomacea canaliculata TaxID=400727 RepID=A0A2T7PY25_POMCA|nr:hypothetical protein C0Q70_00935 [Pomacea canaliculata]